MPARGWQIIKKQYFKLDGFAPSARFDSTDWLIESADSATASEHNPSAAQAGNFVVGFAPNQFGNVSEGAGCVERVLVLSQPSDQVVTAVVQASSYREGDIDVTPQTVTFQRRAG